MKSKLFLIRAGGEEWALEPFKENARIYQKSWLQKLLQLMILSRKLLKLNN